MRYARSVTWVFDQKDWPMTLLWLSAASLVPMVGQVVANGYQAVAAVELGRGGGREEVSPFDLNLLADYLIRGLRLFLVGLVASVLMVPLIFVGLAGMGIVGAIAGAATAGPQGQPSPLLAVVMVLGGFAIAVLTVGLTSLVAPLWLRAAYLDDLAAAYDWEFCKDFWRRAGVAALLCHLGMALIAIVLVPIGMLFCLVGIFPAIGLVFLAQAHLYAQLYQLYLERGGSPIAATPPVATP